MNYYSKLLEQMQSSYKHMTPYLSNFIGYFCYEAERHLKMHTHPTMQNNQENLIKKDK